MKKTTDEELNAWRYQFPTAIVSLRIVGDPVYARGFMGEGKVLLHSVINAMKFNNLGQHQNEKRFSDGTVVRAKSIFGHNTVEIDVSKSSIFAIPGKEECTITFVYLNKYVQPMHYPGEVRGGEQEGIDYVKTYYTFDKSKCPSCEDEIEWEFTFNYETKEQIDYYDSEPKNHCVISQDGGCSGEIIEHGKDEDGTYIIWKVYTEAGSHNRSGLGYANFHAMLRNRNTGEIVCEVTEIIGVDCCIKDRLENPKIYWERTEHCASGIYYYGGTTLCEVPAFVGISHLIAYVIQGRGEARFYALPEIGGCPPYQWTLSGKGSLEITDEWGRIATYKPPTNWSGCDPITITMRDRCAGTHSIIFSYCEFASALEISYISLIMGCDEEQTLSVSGGYGPYFWSVTGGGGSIEGIGDGSQATYKSPSSNVNCASNPTITVTDCCGKSKSLKLAVNCYTPDSIVFLHSDISICKCDYRDACPVTICPTDYPYCISYNHWVERFRCDNTLKLSCYTQCGKKGCCEGMSLGCTNSISGDCTDFMETCYTGQCGGCPASSCPCIIDYRTEYQKSQGCCPINPATGLPF